MESLPILTIGLIILATRVAYLMHRNNREFEKAMEMAKKEDMREQQRLTLLLSMTELLEVESKNKKESNSIPTCTYKKNKTYTPEEIMQIMNFELSNEELAKQLGRTVKGIKAKRYSLKELKLRDII